MGPTFPELVEALPGVPIIDRSSVNAFDDPKVAQAITATGRKKLILAGISLEVCAAFPAITAVGKGLDAYVAVDASGTFSETKRQVAITCRLCARALRPKADRSRVEYRGAVGDRGSRKT
ncbi:MAG: isochorismatase family protein [Chthoniobacterales bacterium]